MHGPWRATWLHTFRVSPLSATQTRPPPEFPTSVLLCCFCLCLLLLSLLLFMFVLRATNSKLTSKKTHTHKKLRRIGPHEPDLDE